MFPLQIGEEYCRLDPHYKEPLQVIFVVSKLPFSPKCPHLKAVIPTRVSPSQSCHSHQSVPILLITYLCSHLTEGGLLSQSLCNLAPAEGGSEDHRWDQQDNKKEELRKIIFRIHV